MNVLHDVFVWWLKLALSERVGLLMLVVGSPTVWIYEAVRYRRLLKKGPRLLRLAPINMRGQLLDALGPGGVAAALSAELFSIREALARILGTRPCPYLAPAIVADSGYYMVGLRHEAPIPLEVSELEVQKVKQAFVLKVGSVSIPMGELIDMLITLVGLLPVPGRRRYLDSLIQVSIVQTGEQSRLQVSRAAHTATNATYTVSRGFKAANSTIAFTQTTTTRTLSELGAVIRDAAFMILEMQGSFGDRRWRSMRRLLDGLEALDDYRRNGSARARDCARQSMREAAENDPDNLEALYYHSVLTMVDQTDGAIDTAARCLERALELRPKGSKGSERLRSVSHSALAYCHAQRWHRLGRRRPEVLKEALSHAQAAEQEWAALQSAHKGLQDHPLLPYTRALVTTVDEGASDPQSRKKRFVEAYGLYQQAIQLQPDNGMFYNNCGWVLLKLAEWGVTKLTKSESGIEEPDVALRAEQLFQASLGLNPENKLVHANLCLLYSVARFREDPANGSLNRARYHGLRAVRIDPHYVNGHRDLAVALVRFGRLDEAYGYYCKALELAELPDKDSEITKDLVAELQKRTDLQAGELKRWAGPPARLLQPGATVQP